MKIEWQLFLERLNAFGTEAHKILPPCAEDRLEAIQAQLGKMPTALVEMLRTFDGAQLFDNGGPLVSIFGISTIPPLPPLEWAPDWYIDKFTPVWRAKQKRNDWAIGITSYGVLFLMDQEGAISKWDTGQKGWESRNQLLGQWMEELMREGESYLKGE